MGKIAVYQKNKIDLSKKTAITITMTDSVATNTGQDYVNFLRDRLNYTGHATTGSDDSALTRFDIDTGDAVTIDTIALIRKNYADYTFQYYNGVSYVDFSPIIDVAGDSEPNDAEGTKVHSFDPVTANLYRLIAEKTYPINVDKILRQLILTRKVGEFESEPEISPFKIEEQKNVKVMMSGRSHISKRFGGVSCELRFRPTINQNDHDLIETIYDTHEGLLFQFVGGDDSKLPVKVRGFRKEDWFFMAPNRDRDNSFFEGRFANGVPSRIKLVEVV